MTIKRVLLVKYGEIALRKGNRTFFEYSLMNIIKERLKIFYSRVIHVKREQGRFLLEDPIGDIDYDGVIPHIKSIFGIIGFCHAAMTTSRDITDLSIIAHRFLLDMNLNADTFRVETKRSDKSYPLTSNDVSALIGGYIYNSAIGLKVDLHNPDITLKVEIRNNIYFYVDAEKGEGGLPYSSSGKAMLMLSGGFDSPVAGYLAARRGVEIIPVYFHSPPFVSERALDKVIDIVKVLSRFTGKIKLYEVGFTDIQLYLKDNVPLEKLTILMKRTMLKLASSIGNKEKVHGIITGDAIGQVSSQTLQSIAAISTATDLPILRPLATMDKQDIVDTATRIGTMEISIRPYDDCCTLFIAKHPVTKPNKNVIERLESRIFADLEPLVQIAIDKCKIHYFP